LPISLAKSSCAFVINGLLYPSPLQYKREKNKRFLMVCGIGFEVSTPNLAKFPHLASIPQPVAIGQPDLPGVLSAAARPYSSSSKPSSAAGLSGFFPMTRISLGLPLLTMDMRLIAADHRLENDGNERHIEYVRKND
jgi:hypothetical protein